MRSLVKHHQIKPGILGVKILRHGDGAHQQTGSEAGQQVGNLLKQLADRERPSITLDRPLEDAQFRALGSLLQKIRNFSRQACIDFPAGQFLEVVIGLPELADFLFEQLTGEKVEGGLPGNDIISAGLIQSFFKGGDHFSVFQPPGLISNHQGTKSGCDRFLAGSNPRAPFPQTLRLAVQAAVLRAA